MSALTLWIDNHGSSIEVIAMLVAGFALYWAGFEAGRRAARKQA
jgi:hypothetical protein